MKHDSRTSVLFDRRNLDLNTFYSQTNFYIEEQVTIHAINLHPGDEITFEVIYLKSGTMPEVCGCYILPGEMPAAIGSTQLLCDDCDEDGVKMPVRLTPDNPVIILDSPQGVILRAVYEGTGIGESTVWAVSGTETQDLTAEMRGCPTVCCVPDPESRQSLGQERCNLDTDMVEVRSIDNCGNIEWLEDRPIRWEETGQIRCNQDWDLEQDDFGTVSIQEVNDCGDVRWDKTRPQRWTVTGVTRCVDDEGNGEGEGEVLSQVVNDCGDIDWIYLEDQTWVPTGVTRCLENNPTLDSSPHGGIIERQEVNDCGFLRWEFDGYQTWTETGQIRCVHDTDDVEVQVVNDCGDLAWIVHGTQIWTPTGEIRCNDDVRNDTHGDYLFGPGTFDIKEVNQCGDIRWVAGGAQQWDATGNERCEPGNDLVSWFEIKNQCGDILWRKEPYGQKWNETGLTRCEANLVQRQEVNQCGRIRWVDTAEHCGYFATYRLPCEGLAYRPGEQPPDATVELKDCDDNVIGYLYDTPREGASTPVMEGCDDPCGSGTVIGYAVDAVHPKCGKTVVSLDDYVTVLNPGMESIMMEFLQSLQAKGTDAPATSNGDDLSTVVVGGREQTLGKPAGWIEFPGGSGHKIPYWT